MELTAEEIAKHYSAAMDSVNFINEINAGEHDERMTAEEKADALSRNKAHLRIQLSKSEMYAGFDLKPFQDAVAE
jgi:hypothetical protein